MQQPTSTPAATSGRLATLERYLEVDPDNATLLADAIDSALAEGALERAELHLTHALALTPNDPFLLARRGNLLLHTAQWEGAAALFAQLLAAAPNSDLAYNLGYACLRLGRHADAAAALLPYADGAPLHAMVLLLRALHNDAQVGLAVALVHAHEARFADDVAFLAAASLVLTDAGDVHGALRLGEKALAGGVRPLEAVVACATVRLGEGDGTSARGLFEEAVALHPRDGRSWSGLGMASLLARDLDQAAQQLNQALHFMPNHIGSWHALGWCHVFGKDLELADQAFRAALALDRNFGDSHGGVAVVAALRGQREAAQAGIDRALGLDPASLSARYAQMVLTGQADDPERMRALVLRVMASRPTPMGKDFQSAFEANAPR
jgi:tetratricopeptide (TPR) repeat protein